MRDSVGPLLPRVDANTMYMPSGDHAGSKLSIWMPLTAGSVGVICVHVFVVEIDGVDLERVVRGLARRERDGVAVVRDVRRLHVGTPR